MIEPTAKEIDEILDMLKGGSVEVRQPRLTNQERDYKKISYIKWISFLIGFLLFSFVIFLLCKHYLVDPCSKVICRNGGTCSLDTEKKPQCVCRRGFGGENCHIMHRYLESSCSKNKCLNGGFCEEDKFGSFYCNCSYWFSGTHCEVNNLCLTVTCQNNGTCTSDEREKTKCICQNGFEGEYCEFGPCSKVTCQAGRTCSLDTENKAQCVCRRGFEGENCEKFKDYKLYKELKSSRERIDILFHIKGLVFINDDILASSNTIGSIKLWSFSTGRELKTLSHYSQYGSCSLAFNGDNILASGSFNGTINLWDITTGKELSTLTGLTDMVSKLVFITENVLASLDGDVKLWNVKTGQVLATLERNRRSIAYNNDNILAIGNSNGFIELYDIKKKVSLSTLSGIGSAVFSLAFNSDNVLVVSYEDGTIELWNVTTGQELKTIIGHTKTAYFIAFRSDYILVKASAKEDIIFWDVTTGRELSKFKDSATSLAFNKNKMAYYSYRDETIKLWSQ